MFANTHGPPLMLQTHYGTTPATQHFAYGKGFLSTFDNSTPPKLYIICEAAEDDAFDQSLGQGMGLGENFAMVGPGFAEHDLDEHDKAADRLVWTRSLATVRKGFGAEVELEKIWEEHVE
ncbi:hypothetical protein LTR28_011870, partial [Elasticomyces elasticus]